MAVTNIFALDIGEKRIGIARANSIARLPQPLATIANDAAFPQIFSKLIDEYDISTVVVGLPRNMQGHETAQSRYTRSFANKFLGDYNVVWQDETLTSNEAEQRSDQLDYGIDAAAACIILEDYLLEHP